jgi:hypothetical protein
MMSVSSDAVGKDRSDGRVVEVPYFKTSLRAKKVPSDPVALKKYIYKVRYTGIKVKKHKELYNSVVERLNLLTDEDFASLSRTMINRLKGLNEALIEFQKLEADERRCSEEDEVGVSPTESTEQTKII